MPAKRHGQLHGANGPSRMTQFWGTHHNKRDLKGRVSIPAPFRTALKGQAEASAPVSLVVRPSHKHACIEAWPIGEFQRLAGPLDQLEIFSEDQEDLAAVLYPDALRLECDREGRVLLPEPLVRHAGLGDLVTFLGLGRIFQIWEPVGAEQRRAAARERVLRRGLTLPSASSSPGPALASPPGLPAAGPI